MKNQTSVSNTPPTIAPAAFQSLLYALDEGVILLDEAFKVIWAAPAAEQLLRCENMTGQLLSRALRQAWRGANKSDLPAKDIEAFVESAGRKPRELIASLRTEATDGVEDGRRSWRSIKMRPFKLSLPDIEAVAHWLVTVQDVTEFHRHEDQLINQLNEMASQNKQWQTIYQGVQESIVLLDTRGRVLTLNRATEQMTGYKAGESIGRHIGELFSKVGPMGSGADYKGRSGLADTLASGQPSEVYEAMVETKDKGHIWVNYTYTPLRDERGQLSALVRVTSDVTASRAMEQMKNDFVSIASHELRTPLGVINGYLNLFLNGQLGDLTADQHAFLERLYHASTDLVVLVEDLLNVSRIEAGRLEVSVKSFDVSTLIQEILDHLQPRYEAKHIVIKQAKPKDPIMVRADEQKVGQALTNLIDNAIKYTYDNGAITISIKRKPQAVEVIVKDSGVGIKPENLRHIFEKFYRENNPLSVREGGSGLGLYISRKLVELHGGAIGVQSKFGQGSEFTISLPSNL